MDCLQCGAKLGKSDIYCIECSAPVLTEDDVTTRLNTDNTKYIDIVTNTEPEPISDTMPYIEQEFSPDFEDSGSVEAGFEGSEFDMPELEIPELMIPELEISELEASVSEAPESMTQIYEKSNGKSKALKRLKSMTLRGFHRIAHTHKDEELPEPVPTKSNRTAVIAITIVVCIALIGTGMYILLRTPETDDEQDAAEPAPVIAVTNDSVDQSVPAAAEPPPAIPIVVSDIIIYNGDHVQTAFHTMIDGTVLLRAQIVPEDVDIAIMWISSDIEVLEVVPLDSRGTEAHLIGKSAGIVDIIVLAGDFEVVFPVTVDDYPLHLQLEEAILNSAMPIWIEILWSNDRENLLQRDPETGLWYWEDGLERGEVYPRFGNDGVAFSFTFTEDSAEVNYLFADGSGYRKRQDRADIADDSRFTWEFSTSRIEPEG